MARPQTYAIVFLALSTAALGWLSYNQYLELVKLRTSSSLSEDERKALLAKIKGLEKSQADMKGMLALKNQGSEGEDEGEEARPENPRERGDRRGPRMGGRDMFMDMFAAAASNPDVLKLLSTQQKGMIENRYAAMFKLMNMTPEEQAKFKSLVAERQNAVMDVLAAAREQGLNGRENRDQIRAMIDSAQAEVDNSVKALLGDQRYDQYKSYETTMPQRSTVDQLTSRLSYTQTPLSSQQSEALISILASSGGTTGGGNRGGFGGGIGAIAGAGPTQSAQITTQAITQAQGILSQPQIAALQQMQAEQQAQAQLARLMRPGNNNNNSTRRSTGTTTQPKQ